MRLRWTPAAAADLHHINDYLKEHYPHYREATMRKLYQTIRSLKDSPHRGRPGREAGTREILFPPMPYIAVYRIREESIEVRHRLAVSRGRRARRAYSLRGYDSLHLASFLELARQA